VNHSRQCSADAAALDRLGAIALREQALERRTPGRRTLPRVFRFEDTTFTKRANSSQTVRLTPEAARATGGHLAAVPPTRYELAAPGSIGRCPDCRSPNMVKAGHGWTCGDCSCKITTTVNSAIIGSTAVYVVCRDLHGEWALLVHVMATWLVSVPYDEIRRETAE
jgi:hypothetical protein